jgi:hypothetical protein
MRRYRTLAALAVGTFLTTAALPAAATPLTANEAAAVTAVRVVPGAGRADVVLSLSGDVTVADFTLTNPHRVVVDVRGATMQLRAPAYDRVSRAGIMNVRLAQFDPTTVRLVLDLDGAREYSVVRGDGELRISVTGPDAFAPWGAGAAAVAAAPAGPVASPEAVPAAQDEAPAPAARFEALSPRTPMVQQAQSPRINVEFNQTPIREVIGFFSSFSGRTIITGSTVSGTVTANIPGQPWDIALSKILQANGLSAVEDSTGIITIDSYRNLAARVAAEPLVTKVVPGELREGERARRHDPTDHRRLLVRLGVAPSSTPARTPRRRRPMARPAGGAPCRLEQVRRPPAAAAPSRSRRRRTRCLITESVSRPPGDRPVRRRPRQAHAAGGDPRQDHRRGPHRDRRARRELRHRLFGHLQQRRSSRAARRASSAWTSAAMRSPVSPTRTVSSAARQRCR